MPTTPRFWSSRNSFLSIALLPASWLYGLGHAVHQRLRRPRRAGIPVICVGNLTAGGSGKTPVALAIADLVTGQGIAARPFFLTRGYGGRAKGPLIAELAHHNAAQIGDEAVLLARKLPTCVAADRAAGAMAAVKAGADLIIMDDGLQNTGLEKMVSLAVIDAGYGFGNGRLIPAGPLRTPIATGLANIDAVITIGGPAPPEVAASGKPVFSARLVSHWTPQPGQNYYGFCGIGRPEKFRATLQECGASLAGFKAFPDHHPYKDNEITELEAEARRCNARLITTEKDAVRISEFDGDVVPVRLVFDEKENFIAFLKQIFSGER